MMDTFYEENQENNIKMLKNKMTLDFNSPASHSKKAKLMKTCVLESPDLKMLKLASPELERMIIQQNGMVTTTPTPSSLLPYFLKSEVEPTEEQELYARGFVDALNQLHQTNGQQNQNHCLTNNNNHNNNNQSNSHLNSNSNQNTLNTSSDSSCDLTIADTNSNNKSNNRRNSYHILVPPPPTSVSILTNTTTAETTETKFAVPQIPSTHVPTTVSSATSGVSSGTEQYVSVSSCQTNGSHVLINQTVNTHNNHNSVLPPYSQAVNDNNNNNNCEKIDRTYSTQPIDMEDQERIKLERKRLRNRIAASKCRRRKLERISKLEDKVKGLKGENSELSIVINKLRDQVCSLKQQVMEHVKCGCQLMVCQ